MPRYPQGLCAMGRDAPIAIDLAEPASCVGGTPWQGATRFDHFEVITDRAALERLGPEWDALWQRASDDYLMQTSDWARTTLDNPPDARPRRLFCLTGRREGRLGLIWPFVVYRNNGLRMASPVAAEWGDYSSVLVENCDDAEARVAAAWRAARAACPCDVFDLRYVRESSRLQRVLVRDRSVKMLLYALEAPWIELKGFANWDEYWRGINATHRRDLGRKHRRLAELGNLRIEEVTDPVRGAEIIDWMIAHKRVWLEHAGREDKIRLRTDEYPRFLQAQVRTFFASGRCRIFVLMLGERILAMDLASIDKTRFECNVGTFDYEFRRFSPGHILKQHHIRWALERGLDYDMRLGDGEHKKFWGNRIENTFTYRVANSPVGVGYMLLKRAVAQQGQVTALLRRLSRPGGDRRRQAG